MSKLDEEVPIFNASGKEAGADSALHTDPELQWQLKDGTIVHTVKRGSIRGSYETQGAYKGLIGQIYVDIGGIKGPHRAGKEVFSFIVDNSGVLIPFCSNAIDSLALYPTKYTYDHSSSSIYNHLACTGAVADNGWNAPW